MTKRNILAIIFLTMLAIPSAARTLYIGDDDPRYAEACKTITPLEIVDAAIRWYVEWGLRFERDGRGRNGDVNPYPYRSIAHFKEVNEDCCQLLEKIPGDYEPEVQELGNNSGGYRRLYAVRMKFIQQTDAGPITRYSTPFINCFGNRPEWR